jgi:hypothetical protein
MGGSAYEYFLVISITRLSDTNAIVVGARVDFVGLEETRRLITVERIFLMRGKVKGVFMHCGLWIVDCGIKSTRH